MALPPEIVQLINLRSLRTKSNQLQGIPIELGQLSQLTELDLSNNQITTFPSSLVTNSPLSATLQRLILPQNKLKSLPNDFNQFTALELLYVSDNRLQDLPPNLFQTTSSIKGLCSLCVFSASNNQITTFPNHLQNLPSLTSLDLSFNKISSVPLDFLHSLPPNCIELELSHNHITSFSSKTSKESLNLNSKTNINLTALDLSFNQISSFPSEFPEILHHLNKLILNNNKLTSFPSTVSQMTNLSVLRLNDNQLSEVPPQIGFLVTLRHLTLDNNYLSSLPAEFDEIEPLLESFSFENNLFSDRLLELPDIIHVSKHEHDHFEDEILNSKQKEEEDVALVIEMVKEGEVFVIRERTKRPEKVKMRATNELESIEWIYKQGKPNVTRVISWSATKIRKESVLASPTMEKSSPASVTDENIKPGASAIERKDKILIKDMEEIQLGRMVRSSDDKIGKMSMGKLDDCFFCIVTADRTVEVETHSQAERDEWAKAFLTVIRKVAMLNYGGDWLKIEEEDEDELIKQVDNAEEKEDKEKKEEKKEEEKEEKAEEEKKGGKKGKKKKSKKKKKKQEDNNNQSPATPSSKKKRRKSKKNKEETEVQELERRLKERENEKKRLGLPLGQEEIELKTLIEEIKGIEEKTKVLAAKAVSKKEKRKEKKAEIKKKKEEEIKNEEDKKKEDDQPNKKEEEKKKKEEEEGTKKREEEEQMKKRELDEKRKKEEDERKRKEEEEQIKIKEEEERRKKEEQKRKQLEDEQRKRQEEDEKRRKEEEIRLKKEEQKRKEHEEAKRKARQDKLEEMKKKIINSSAASAASSTPTADSTSTSDPASPTATTSPKIAATDQKSKSRIEKLAKDRETKKQELFDKRAKERQAKMAALKKETITNKAEVDKNKERLEKEAQERKDRLLKLREASIKRLNEQQGVLQALAEKKAEEQQQTKESNDANTMKVKPDLESSRSESSLPSTTPTYSTNPTPSGKTSMLDLVKFRQEQQLLQQQEAKQQETKQQEVKQKEVKQKEVKLIDMTVNKNRARMASRRLPTRQSRRERRDTETQRTESSSFSQKEEESGTPEATPETLRKREMMARQRSIPRSVRTLDAAAFEAATNFSQNATTQTQESNSVKTNFCSACGSRLKPDARFCSECGNSIPSTASPVSSNASSPTTPSKFIQQSTSPSSKPLTEVEQMRLRIAQRNANKSAAATNPNNSPTNTNPSTTVAVGDEDYETKFQRAKQDQIQAQKESEKQERKTIIKNFQDKNTQKADAAKTRNPKLLHLKGKKSVKVALVESHYKVLNEGDVFIYYIPQTASLYIFYGNGCNLMEKAKAAAITTRINFHECSGKAKITTVTRASTDPDDLIFWNALGAQKEEKVLSEEAGGNDIAYERMFYSHLTLEKCLVNTEASNQGDSNSRLTMEQIEIPAGGMSKKLLQNDTCYVLDSGPSCVWLWSGRNASNDVKTFTETYWKEIFNEKLKKKLQESNLTQEQERNLTDKNTKVYMEREVDGGESILFREQFTDWGDEISLGGGFGGRVSSLQAGIGGMIRTRGASIGGGGGGEEGGRGERESMMDKRRREKNAIDLNKLHDFITLLEEEGTENNYYNEYLHDTMLEVWQVDQNQDNTLIKKNLLYEKELPELLEINNKESAGESVTKTNEILRQRISLWSGNSYIILFSFRGGGETGKSEVKRSVIYYWAGRDCSKQETGKIVLQIKEISKLVQERGYESLFNFRIEQGMESSHFLKTLKRPWLVNTSVENSFTLRSILIHCGKEEDYSSNVTNSEEPKKVKGNRMRRKEEVRERKKDRIWHIKGMKEEYRIIGMEIKEGIQGIRNKRDAYILSLDEGKHWFVWRGSLCLDSTYAIALQMSKTLLLTFQNTNSAKLDDIKQELEGKESSILLDKLKSTKSKSNAMSTKLNTEFWTRIYECGSIKGDFRAEERLFYVQEILESNNIYIIDCYEEMYVWIGSHSYEEDEIMAMEIAVDYVKTCTDGRMKNIDILRTVQGKETDSFKSVFIAWDEGLARKKGTRKEEEDDEDEDEEDKEQDNINEEQDKKSNTTSGDVRRLLEEYGRVYTIEELRKKPPPKGLDKTKLEKYLSDEDFIQLLKMTKDEFYKQPGWVQNNKRKDIGLY